MELKLFIEEFAYYGKYDGEELESRYVANVNGSKDEIIDKLITFTDERPADSESERRDEISKFINKVIAGDKTANAIINVDATGGDWDEPTDRVTVISLYDVEGYIYMLTEKMKKDIDSYVEYEKHPIEIS